MTLRKWFEVGNVTLRVVVENNARVEDIVGVEEMFYLFHELEGISTPLAFDVWSHVATCAMFGFERAIVVTDYHIGNIFHKSLVAIDFGLRVEALVDDEVVVAFEGMTIYYSIVIVVMLKELLKFFCGLDEMVDWEGNVFDEASSAYGTHTAH